MAKNNKTLTYKIKEQNKKLTDAEKFFKRAIKELNAESEKLKKKRLEKEYYERYEKQFPIDNSNRAGGRK